MSDKWNEDADSCLEPVAANEKKKKKMRLPSVNCVIGSFTT